MGSETEYSETDISHAITLASPSSSRHGGVDAPATPLPLPSEHRYSATLVLGLGIVHILLGSLNTAFAIMALFVEPEVNQLVSGAWTGLLHVGTGCLGILAYTRWYIRHQIVFFLFGSVAGAAAAVVCIFFTSAGMYLSAQRLFARQQSQEDGPYITNYYNPDAELNNTGRLGVTANIIVASILELLWCVVSIRVAFRGSLAPEYNFSSAASQDMAANGGKFFVQLQTRGLERQIKRQVVWTAYLPPNYSHSNLCTPYVIRNGRTQTSPNVEQVEVVRVNPLCSIDDI